MSWRNFRRRADSFSRRRFAADLLAEGLDGVGLRDRARELVVDGGQPLLLERGEGDLVVHRLSRGSSRWENRRGRSCGKSACLPDRGARQRVVDLGHRVGVPDLERDLLVPERARVLAGLEDLHEASRDVRHGVVAGGRGAFPRSGWNSACDSRIRSTTRSTSSSDGSIGTSSTGIPRYSPGIDRRLQVELRREADRPRRVPLELLDPRVPRGSRGSSPRWPRRQRRGQQSLDDLLADLSRETLLDECSGTWPLRKPGIAARFAKARETAA